MIHAPVYDTLDMMAIRNGEDTQLGVRREKKRYLAVPSKRDGGTELEP